jgi:hypothetical protein
MKILVVVIFCGRMCDDDKDRVTSAVDRCDAQVDDGRVMGRLDRWRKHRRRTSEKRSLPQCEESHCKMRICFLRKATGPESAYFVNSDASAVHRSGDGRILIVSETRESWQASHLAEVNVKVGRQKVSRRWTHAVDGLRREIAANARTNSSGLFSRTMTCTLMFQVQRSVVRCIMKCCTYMITSRFSTTRSTALSWTWLS